MTDRPDIYIGLVAAAGTDLYDLKAQLRAQFAAMGYSYHEIKVSNLLSKFATQDVSGLSEDKRVHHLMNIGDAIRTSVNQGDGVTSLIMAEIRRYRESKNPNDAKVMGFVGATVFVIDSLKNPSEINALDKVYARNYYTISAYTPETVRLDLLAHKIAKQVKQTLSNIHYRRARKILERDQGVGPVNLSQNVLGTFPRADFFVRTDSDLAKPLKRFAELIFSSPYITPTQDEHFMHLARAASLRSCDLSRQVGAVIVDGRGAVISQGCNEVPYPGGGIYYEGRVDGFDNRDYTVSQDPNQAEILEVVRDFMGVLEQADLLKPSSKTVQELGYELLFGSMRESTAQSRIRNLLEFGRVVHAEMHAICEAARLGREIDGTTLYCTTFPCHGCAKHIIATGIKEVVFIEPYPKSLTKKMYINEISTDDGLLTLPNAVRFRPFEGVSPVLFRRVFNMRSRKDKEGQIVKWDGLKAKPIKAVAHVLNYTEETAYIKRLADIRKSAVVPEVPKPIRLRRKLGRIVL
jgi:cytidine deaminase